MSGHDEIFKFANVVGHGIGYKVTGGVRTSLLSRIVMVEKKLPLTHLAPKDVIPKVINGEITDVIQTGRFRAYWAIPRTDVYRPALGGISIGHPNITAGTLGCAIWKADKKYILSNNHVIADQNDANIGDGILQPGRSDGGDEAIAELSDFEPLDFVGGVNVMDAAIALPYAQSNLSEEILDLGNLGGTTVAALDMLVTKSGRTTEVTEGIITILDANIEVGYGGGRTCLFEDVIIAEIDGAPGDSGSIVATQGDLLAVGLLFAGEGDLIACNDINVILDRFSATAHHIATSRVTSKAGKWTDLLSERPIRPTRRI